MTAVRVVSVRFMTILSNSPWEDSVQKLSLQSTPDNSNLQGKLRKVRIVGSLKQITGSKEISKWMGRECNWATKYTGMDTEFELEWQKSKDKELTRLFWNKFNVSDFSTRFSALYRGVPHGANIGSATF